MAPSQPCPASPNPDLPNPDPTATADTAAAGAWTRRLVDGWVAERVGTLRDAERAALTARWPDWQPRAAALIAEGLLAYVAVEMVAPDLAISAVGGHAHDPDHDDLAARLGAHLRDFVDYRDMVSPPGPGTTGTGDCGHDHAAAPADRA